VIVMALARVGAAAGPDLAGIAAARALGMDRRIYAAGGVRGPEDLRALRGAGAAGVLVASAIHDGRLRAGDLSE
jgi:phosphoribosylformimino-5-aminoimidazole carboxamide ribotide isomerase